VLRLTENSDTKEARSEVLSSFSEVFNIMERIDDSLIAARHGEARWAGVLAGGLVSLLWAVIGMSLISILFPVPGGPGSTPGVDHVFLLGTLIPFLILGPLAGVLTYFYTKKSYTKKFISHKKTLHELGEAVREQRAKDTNVIEKTLQLMDQMSDWMPKLLRYKSDEALGYGFAAFLVVAFISLLFSATSLGLPISLLVGVLVWLYFRQEKRKEVEGQIQKFGMWKQKFEEDKSAFLETV
jgi:Na+/proline symporter